jgi:hypothetical protein
VRFEASVLFEPDVEQGGVGDEEQHRADKRDRRRKAGQGNELIQREAVHCAVCKKIRRHGIEELFRQIRPEPAEDERGDGDIRDSRGDDEPERNDGEVNVIRIGGDEAYMGYQKAYSAGREPLDALGDEQHVAQPACEYGGDDDGQRVAHAEAVPAQQRQQDNALGLSTKPGVAFEACVKVD